MTFECVEEQEESVGWRPILRTGKVLEIDLRVVTLRAPDGPPRAVALTIVAGSPQLHARLERMPREFQIELGHLGRRFLAGRGYQADGPVELDPRQPLRFSVGCSLVAEAADALQAAGRLAELATRVLREPVLRVFGRRLRMFCFDARSQPRIGAASGSNTLRHSLYEIARDFCLVPSEQPPPLPDALMFSDGD